MLPIAVDVMGGDHGPGEIVAGATQAAEAGVEVVLVGDPEAIGTTQLEVVPALEVIDMGEDPAGGVRRKKDASVVRAAELVRDGKAAGMLSAGNTGAAMAAALLRMGRISAVARPAVATVIPVVGQTPVILLDSGANSECQAQWLVQFAQMGSVLVQERYGKESPRVGLLSIGEEPTKGTTLVKETHKLLQDAAHIEFVGNVEGRDILTGTVDVVVTDGFTGNVVLKTLEGASKMLISAVMGAMMSTEESKQAAKSIMPVLAPLAEEVDPESYGGAMLLGVEGVCVITHGASSSKAIANAIRIGGEMVEHDLVAKLRSSVATV